LYPTRRALFAAPLAAFAQTERQTITSVRAAAVALLPTSRFGKKEFESDFDPARRRWFGPFSQLAGSILVEIRTKEGLTGYGLGGGGTAAAERRPPTSSTIT